VAGGLTLVAGGGSRAAGKRAKPEGLGEPFRLPQPSGPTLSELFAPSPRDGGWAGFLLPQLAADKPVLWVQDRMAIREAGRIHPAGLGIRDLIHVGARDGRDALWAMEEGLRCPAIGAVIGELWGDPASLDFTATRRLAVAAERSQVPCWLVRLGGTANLSGARMRWRVASSPSLPHPFDFKAPGAPAWDAELFRARTLKTDHPPDGSFSPSAPGRWDVAYEADRFHLLAASGDRALAQGERSAA
jgi:protein ImuA